LELPMTSQTAPARAPQPPILLREMIGSVAVLTLNRPEARNSLSEGLIAELDAALRKFQDDASVRAVVIAASGNAFSAGHDMKELTARRTDADRGRAYFAEIMTACSTMMQAIVHLPKPVVAAVNGVATAAGCQLVASCDLAVASEDATFATPGVNIGAFCSTPGVALGRAVGRKHAMEMLLTGAAIDAARAHEIGLVNRVVPAEALDAEVSAVATVRVTANPRFTFFMDASITLIGGSQTLSPVLYHNLAFRTTRQWRAGVAPQPQAPQPSCDTDGVAGGGDAGPEALRWAFRDKFSPDYRHVTVGFRFARTLR